MTNNDKTRYCNHRAYNGAALKEGEVLIPEWFKRDFKNSLDTAIDENFTTWTIGGYKFLIGFVPVEEEKFEGCMKAFWQKINEQLETFRTGRCILGYSEDGSPKVCPKANHCTHCPEKGLYQRYTPQFDAVSLSYSADVADCEAEEADYPDMHHMDPAEEATMEDVFLDLVEHLRSINPRYADIVTLRLGGFSPKEIIDQLQLKSSRGYQEISRAEELTREYWHMPKRR